SLMLGRLQDDYTYVREGRATLAWHSQESACGSVSSRLLPGKIAYLSISSFASKQTADEMRAALERWAGVEGYILDLRNNHGGSVAQARRVFAMFCTDGKFGSFAGRDGNENYEEQVLLNSQEFKWVRTGHHSTTPRDPCLALQKPLAVIVNTDTRSAAEMLAGALKDNGRASLVGTRTYGKSLVQQIVQLGDGLSAKVVIARYYRPSGAPFDGVGLEPDFTVADTAYGDQQLIAAVTLVRTSLAKEKGAKPAATQ